MFQEVKATALKFMMLLLLYSHTLHIVALVICILTCDLDFSIAFKRMFGPFLRLILPQTSYTKLGKLPRCLVKTCKGI